MNREKPPEEVLGPLEDKGVPGLLEEERVPGPPGVGVAPRLPGEGVAPGPPGDGVTEVAGGEEGLTLTPCLLFSASFLSSPS